MKNHNLKPRSLDRQSTKTGRYNDSSKGITMRLLEKYKPKGLLHIESDNNKKISKEIGLKS